MKRSVSLWLILVSILSVSAQALVVDEIIAWIYHPAGTRIVLRSELYTSVDGKARDIKELVMDIAMELEAKNMKIEISDEELDRYLATIQKQNGLTHAELIRFFEEMGYSYSEGREMLRKKQTVEQYIDYRVRTNPIMNIQKKEALEYYNEHPQKQEAVYTLAMAFVPFTKVPKEKLDSLIKNNKLPSDVIWDEPFEVKASELPEERQFITQKQAGDILLHEEVENGYEITKLVGVKPEQLIPFDDCYHEIIATIRQTRFAEVMKLIHDELTGKVTVVYKSVS